MLVSHNWKDEWLIGHIWGLHRDVLDHSPIIIRYEEFDWGPKPFKFNNLWIKNKDFQEVVMGVFTLIFDKQPLIYKMVTCKMNQ